MKKTSRILAVLTTLFLYCFVISLYSSNAFADSTTFLKHSNSETEQYNSVLSSKLLSHTPPSESSVNLFNSVSPSSLKNSFKEFSACIKAIENSFFHTFSQYSFYSQNVLVRLKQADIIFPFHYFW